MTPDFSLIPDEPLTRADGLSRQFLEMGCHTFHTACQWIWQLPYGSNASQGVDALFRDGCGTCSSKHGVAAALADELGLHVSKFQVYYRLDNTIIAGADEILSAYDVSFVPGRHCILGTDTCFIDLTWGNNTGKQVDLVDFDLFVKVSAFPNQEELEHLDRWVLSFYQLRTPKLQAITFTDAKAIRKACFQAQIRCAC